MVYHYSQLLPSEDIKVLYQIRTPDEAIGMA